MTGIPKLVDLSSYCREGELPVSIIEEGLKGTFEKKAAHQDILEYVESTLDRKPGKMYLHINAMGAGEYYGSNKNGDYFPEENLKRYYKTFESSGYVYRHHINKDPAKSMGRVLFAIYNDRMHRVELVAEVDEELGRDIQEGLLEGKFPFTSMACKTPFDVCSVCENRAHSTGEYCSHLREEINKIYPNGQKVMALNVGPLRFFDISIVIRPADVTSSVLQKVAGEALGLGSAFVAEAEGLNPQDRVIEKTAFAVKKAALKKFSTLIKEVSGGNVVDASVDVEDIVSKIQYPELSLASSLAQFSIGEVLNAFAETGTAPSIKFMAELIAQHHLGGDGVGLGESAEVALYSSDLSEIPAEAIDLLGEVEVSSANPVLIRLILDHSDGVMTPKEVEKRAALYEGYLGQKEYAENLPRYLMWTPEQMQSESNRIAAEMEAASAGTKPGVMKTLLALGGAALLARYYISSLVDKKVEEARMTALNTHYSSPYAKIVFEKQAQVVPKLLDAITAFDIKKAKLLGYF